MILISIYIIALLLVLLFVAGASCKDKQAKLNHKYEEHCKETGQPIDDRLEISNIIKPRSDRDKI